MRVASGLGITASARDLWMAPCWRILELEVAAVEWLKLGVLGVDYC